MNRSQRPEETTDTMTQRKQQPALVKGTATHRRTESDYLSVLLDSVTLDDWRDVVSNTLEAAKGGDDKARAWLAQYLMGKPSTEAPAPLNVVVAQLSGADHLVEKLSKPHLDRVRYPSLHADAETEDRLRALVAEELARKVVPTD